MGRPVRATRKARISIRSDLPRQCPLMPRSASMRGRVEAHLGEGLSDCARAGQHVHAGTGGMGGNRLQGYWAAAEPVGGQQRQKSARSRERRSARQVHRSSGKSNTMLTAAHLPRRRPEVTVHDPRLPPGKAALRSCPLTGRHCGKAGLPEELAQLDHRQSGDLTQAGRQHRLASPAPRPMMTTRFTLSNPSSPARAGVIAALACRCRWVASKPAIVAMSGRRAHDGHDQDRAWAQGTTTAPQWLAVTAALANDRTCPAGWLMRRLFARRAMGARRQCPL